MSYFSAFIRKKPLLPLLVATSVFALGCIQLVKLVRLGAPQDGTGAFAQNDDLSFGIPRTKHIWSNTMEDKLSNSSYRYYLYNNTDLVGLIPARGGGTGFHGAAWAIYDALKTHPLRTLDPNQATFFIPPNIVNLYIQGNTPGRSNREMLKSALGVLASSAIFNSTRGTRHIMFSLDGHHFSWRGVNHLAGDIKNFIKQTSLPSAEKMFNNIILAKDRDMWELRRMHNSNSDYHEWNDLLEVNNPIPDFGFSFGHLPGPDEVPLIHATYNKFIKSEWIFFYHTRLGDSYRNSTIFRHAPIERRPPNGTIELTSFEQSSIGYDINASDWSHRFTRSKFCIVIRGDDPCSRAFLRSVRVGCIPVVVSDLFPRWAPTFKSTLNMSDYAIMIDEQAFIGNPWGELHRVYSELTEFDVKQKLEALQFAQKVMFPDGPKSLFVPAVLTEAWNSIPESQHIMGVTYNIDTNHTH